MTNHVFDLYALHMGAEAVESTVETVAEDMENEQYDVPLGPPRRR